MDCLKISVKNKNKFTDFFVCNVLILVLFLRLGLFLAYQKIKNMKKLGNILVRALDNRSDAFSMGLSFLREVSRCSVLGLQWGWLP